MSERDLRFMAGTCLRKKRYRSEGFAKKVADYVLKTRNEKLRVYPCSVCQGFHLTKQPLPERQV